MAFMALVSLVMVNCSSSGSDGDGDNKNPQLINSWITVNNATMKEGAMPAATQELAGASNSVVMDAASRMANVVIESPEELNKLYVGIEGVNGYMECPAASFVTRATKTFKYTISILLANNVSQNVTIQINAETKDGKLVSVMVKKLDVKNEEGSIASDDVTALKGTWEFVGEQLKNVYKVTDNMIKVENYSISQEGETLLTTNDYAYRYADGMLYLKRVGDPDSIPESKIKPAFLDNKNVLILRWYWLMHDENGVMHEVNEIDDFDLLVRKGYESSFTVNDIQGTWIWNLYGNQDIVRSALILKDNTFDLIIPIWGQRMQGTFTYNNGYIDFKLNTFLVREKEEFTEELVMLYDGWEAIDEKEWEWPLEPTFGKEFRRPFIPDGNVAYSNLANLPVYYIKQ